MSAGPPLQVAADVRWTAVANQRDDNYVGTSIEQRVCKLCHQDVEDETHFMLQWHALKF